MDQLKCSDCQYCKRADWRILQPYCDITKRFVSLDSPACISIKETGRRPVCLTTKTFVDKWFNRGSLKKPK